MGIPFATLPNQELLALMAQRDVQALATLYDRYGCLVYSLALHLTDNRETAEKVTANVFQSIWTAAEGLRAGTCADQSWLIVLTRRAVWTTRHRQ